MTSSPFASAAVALLALWLGVSGASHAHAQNVILPPPWVSPEMRTVAPERPTWRERGRDVYALDAIPREVGSGTLQCPEVELVRYAGDVVRYRGAARVHPAFRERLRAFETIVRDTAIEVYGRAPARMRLMGTYSCRRIRRIDGLISEHAFGNAIDVSGFDFARASASSGAPPGDPRLARAFTVSVARHWSANAGGSLDAVHSRFLRTLMERLIATPGLFRVLIGPADPDHRDHFHLDCAPYRFVNV